MSHVGVDAGSSPEPVKLYPSKNQLGILILPCLLGVAMILQTDGTATLAHADLSWTNIMAIVICLFVAGWLLQMALDRKPVVIFDSVRIHCQRPPLGLITWPAVVGIGAANATLARRVLMVAVEPNRLDEAARNYIRNSVGLINLISPQMQTFDSQAQGYPSVHIGISHLSRPARKIESLAQEFVLYYVEIKGEQSRDGG